MTLLHAFSALKALGPPVFRTADVVAVLRVETARASKILSRLAEYGQVARVKRGLWALTEDLDPLTLVPYVTAPLPSYVSLQTALYYLATGDESFRTRVRTRLREEAEAGRAVLFVSHYVEEVQLLCDRVVSMEAGEIVREGPTREITERYMAEGREVSGEK